MRNVELRSSLRVRISLRSSSRFRAQTPPWPTPHGCFLALTQNDEEGIFEKTVMPFFAVQAVTCDSATARDTVSLTLFAKSDLKARVACRRSCLNHRRYFVLRFAASI